MLLGLCGSVHWETGCWLQIFESLVSPVGLGQAGSCVCEAGAREEVTGDWKLETRAVDARKQDRSQLNHD
jgi:hypothetical protein